jgi:hypothetical protein
MTRAALLLGFARLLFAADPFVGTWRLVPAKSSGTIPGDETVIIEQRGKSALAIHVRIVDAGSLNRTFSIKYTVPKNGGNGRIEAGPYDGVSVERIGPKTIATRYFASGKEVRTTRAIVSSDGNTMTSTGTAPGEHINWTMVFEKQVSPRGENRPVADAQR